MKSTTNKGDAVKASFSKVRTTGKWGVKIVGAPIDTALTGTQVTVVAYKTGRESTVKLGEKVGTFQKDGGILYAIDYGDQVDGNGDRIMTAGWGGTCAICKTPIYKGDRIRYSKAAGARCVEPCKPVELPGEDVVPHGRYAVKIDRKMELVRVSRRKNVRVFDDQEYGKEYNAARVLTAIVKQGPADCARRYGQIMKRCSRCGTHLENRLSRHLAIGPVCGGHFYPLAEWKAIRKAAERELWNKGLDPDETLSADEWAALELKVAA